MYGKILGERPRNGPDEGGSRTISVAAALINRATRAVTNLLHSMDRSLFPDEEDPSRIR